MSKATPDAALAATSRCSQAVPTRSSSADAVTRSAACHGKVSSPAIRSIGWRTMPASNPGPAKDSG